MNKSSAERTGKRLEATQDRTRGEDGMSSSAGEIWRKRQSNLGEGSRCKEDGGRNGGEYDGGRRGVGNGGLSERVWRQCDRVRFSVCVGETGGKKEKKRVKKKSNRCSQGSLVSPRCRTLSPGVALFLFPALSAVALAVPVNFWRSRCWQSNKRTGQMGQARYGGLEAY